MIEVEGRDFGILYVEVGECVNLMAVDSKKGVTNSMVVITTTYSKQRFNTKLVKKTVSPAYEEEFKFITRKLSGKVIFQVYGRQKFLQKPVLLGEVNVSLKRLTIGSTYRRWFKLTNEPKKKPEGPPAKIHLSLFYAGEIVDSPKKSGETYLDYYDQNEEIGRGGFCIVYKCTKKNTDEQYAVKVIDKQASQDEIEYLRREIEIMKILKSEHIISLVASFENDENIFLVTELAEEGELFEEIMEVGVFAESIAANIIKQILEAVDYMHQNGIAHRDLKPENLLITKRTSEGYEIKGS
eukprot:TRINITY_DN2301_c0_g1_i2.p1 TRINITY_DN2301_c0_g1~~TRINITY_DN2301_c0_g1_i2.p1  ORF type:complete len:297 (+),score=58.12 TRINITY_DN2301_c0_g1_i2:847-1737(+)